MFCGFTFGINNNVDNNLGDDCIEETFHLMEVGFDLGFEEEQLTCIANLFYAECEGYEVDYTTCE